MEPKARQTPIWVKVTISITLTILLYAIAGLLGIAARDKSVPLDPELFGLIIFAGLNAAEIFDLVSMHLHNVGADTVSTELDFYPGEVPGVGEPFSRGQKVFFHALFLIAFPLGTFSALAGI